MKTRVFLGGTCNESSWRDELIELLDDNRVSYFNPVVEDWTPECMEEELRQRANCDFCLYVITPKMTGVYSIAEVVDDSNKRPDKTVFCVLSTDDAEEFDKFQLRSLNQVEKMVSANGGTVLYSLENIADFLNGE